MAKYSSRSNLTFSLSKISFHAQIKREKFSYNFNDIKAFLWNKRDSSHFDGIHLMPSSYQLFSMREREMKNLIKVRMWSNFSFKWEILTVCVCEEDCVEWMVEILRCFNIKPWMEMKGGVELHSSVVFRYEN